MVMTPGSVEIVIGVSISVVPGDSTDCVASAFLIVCTDPSLAV